MKLLSVFLLVLAPFTSAGEPSDFKFKPWSQAEIRKLEIFKTVC